jgi:hypothetical protein
MRPYQTIIRGHKLPGAAKMSDHSANQAYDFVVEWLRENELEWVARQIEDEIVIGKPKYGRITIPKPLPQIAVDEARKITKASTSGEFLTREDYTPSEKCEIAIGALDAVVTGAIKIQGSLLSTLSETHNTRIIFASDADDTTYSYQDLDLTEARVRVDELSRLLVELKKEVES